MAQSILGEGETGFHPDGRFVVVTTTLVSTFQIVEGMYPPGSTDEEIMKEEWRAALDDPAAYSADADVSVQVSVFNNEGVKQ